MLFGFFTRKKEEHIHKRIDNVHSNSKQSFAKVREDMSKISDWINHFKEKNHKHEKEFLNIHARLDEIEKKLASLFEKQTAVQTTPQKQTGTNKHVSKQAFEGVQTAVQTAIQLKNLTMMERLVVWTLLNTEIKLSYEDLESLLGKDKSTIRGQINNIKHKSEGLIEERAESDGTKRFYINEKYKNEVLKGLNIQKKQAKKQKVRVQN
ncbi:MAG: hypothetical protein PHG05_01295 [Candidatus Nanoarchaeia archaeon]|nr:hypothetical protein [Candidatus Nanoarchaeia archaeon]